jgi:hypothetical protein
LSHFNNWYNVDGQTKFRFNHKGEKKVGVAGGLCRMWGMSEGKEKAGRGVRGGLGVMRLGVVISRDFSRGMPSELADSALCA